VFRALSNLLYRDRDPTRAWVATPSPLIADVRRCTLCGVALGGNFSGLSALGPSEDARQSSLGAANWRSRGVYCKAEGGQLSAFTLELDRSAGLQPFQGVILNDGQPLAISNQTTPERLQSALGDPFGQSAADGETVLFYEYASGEVQFTFSRNLGTLESIECCYEPDLSWPDQLAWYGIEKPFPEEFRRRL
jgi:hypothetical protein